MSGTNSKLNVPMATTGYVPSPVPPSPPTQRGFSQIDTVRAEYPGFRRSQEASASSPAQPTPMPPSFPSFTDPDGRSVVGGSSGTTRGGIPIPGDWSRFHHTQPQGYRISADPLSFNRPDVMQQPQQPQQTIRPAAATGSVTKTHASAMPEGNETEGSMVIDKAAFDAMVSEIARMSKVQLGLGLRLGLVQGLGVRDFALTGAQLHPATYANVSNGA